MGNRSAGLILIVLILGCATRARADFLTGSLSTTGAVANNYGVQAHAPADSVTFSAPSVSLSTSITCNNSPHPQTHANGTLTASLNASEDAISFTGASDVSGNVFESGSFRTFCNAPFTGSFQFTLATTRNVTESFVDTFIAVSSNFTLKNSANTTISFRGTSSAPNAYNTRFYTLPPDTYTYTVSFQGIPTTGVGGAATMSYSLSGLAPEPASMLWVLASAAMLRRRSR